MTEIQKGKYIFGTTKVGPKGQVVIPQDAREKFDIQTGDEVLILGDTSKGVSIVSSKLLKNFALKILGEINPANQQKKGGG